MVEKSQPSFNQANTKLRLQIAKQEISHRNINDTSVIGSLRRHSNLKWLWRYSFITLNFTEKHYWREPFHKSAALCLVSAMLCSSDIPLEFYQYFLILFSWLDILGHSGFSIHDLHDFLANVIIITSNSYASRNSYLELTAQYIPSIHSERNTVALLDLQVFHNHLLDTVSVHIFPVKKFNIFRFLFRFLGWKCYSFS